VPEYVDIAFDCLPLRLVAKLRPPLDASPEFRMRCERIADAIERLGIERSYWLENAHCTFRLANSEMLGMVRFEFDGVVTTDAGDARTVQVELEVRHVAETCGGVPTGVLAWLEDQVRRAVSVEFDRYISAGHLAPVDQIPPDDAGL
jgi:hypothetical protein